MDPDLERVNGRIDLLYEYCKLNSEMIFKLKDYVDDLYGRVETHKNQIDSLMKLTELDSEILKAVEKEMEQDQVEMADDFTEQIDALKQEIQKINALYAPPDN